MKKMLLIILVLKEAVLMAQNINIRPEYEWMLRDITKYRLSVDTSDYSDYYITLDDFRIIRFDSIGILKNNLPNMSFYVKIYKRNDKDLRFIGESKLRGTYEMPRPQAKLGNIVCGKIKLEELLNEKITADFCDYKIEKKFNIKSFEVILVRNNKSLLVKSCVGNCFSEETKSIISKLAHPGDEIIFYNIITDERYVLNKTLNSINLVITL